MALTKEDLEIKVIEKRIQLEEGVKWTNDKLVKRLGDYTLEHTMKDNRSWGVDYLQSLETVQLCRHLKDEQKAFIYIKKASDKGYSLAYAFLGDFFLEGKQVKQDLDKAFTYYSLGAEAGIAKAQASLSKCYKEGIGTDIDLEKAEKYLKSALNQGYKI